MGPDFPPQSIEMQQAMMMRGGAPPQDFIGPPMGQGMHPGMGMGPGGPPPGPLHSPGMPGMEMGGMSSGMGSPMDPMMMGPGASAMRQASALGPGGSGAMDPSMSMMGPGPGSAGPPSSGYPGGAPPGSFMPNGQPMMIGQGPMPGPSPGGMPGGMPMSGIPRMPGGIPRMPMQAGGPPGPGYGGSGYQQFQQQLYTQGRPRQMSPMAHPMMGQGPPGQPYGMGMIPPNMQGPS